MVVCVDETAEMSTATISTHPNGPKRPSFRARKTSSALSGLARPAPSSPTPAYIIAATVTVT